MSPVEANLLLTGLERKARRHKSLASYHRKRNRETKERLEQFKRRMAQYGIAVKGVGETSHGQRPGSDRSIDGTTG